LKLFEDTMVNFKFDKKIYISTKLKKLNLADMKLYVYSIALK